MLKLINTVSIDSKIMKNRWRKNSLMAPMAYTSSKLPKYVTLSLSNWTSFFSPFFHFKAPKSVSEKRPNAATLWSNANIFHNDGENASALWCGAGPLILVDLVCFCFFFTNIYTKSFSSSFVTFTCIFHTFVSNLLIFSQICPIFLVKWRAMTTCHYLSLVNILWNELWRESFGHL